MTDIQPSVDGSGRPVRRRRVLLAQVVLRGLANLRRIAKRGVNAKGGSIAVTFALSIVVILGAVGLGTDAAMWYSTRRAMQNASDLGAASAINMLKVNLPGSAGADTAAANEAMSATATHSFPNSGNTTVTVNIPPQHGSYTGSAYNHLAAEVIIAQPSPGLFSTFFLSTGPTISTRSVAVIDYSKGDCLLALSPNKAQSFSIAGNGAVNIDCGIAVNSNASSNSAKNNAFYLQGSVSVTATSISVDGGIGTTGGASYSSPGPISTGTTVTDPYGSTTIPTLVPGQSGTVSPATIETGDITSSVTYSGGGVIRGNINISNATVTLNSGIYYIDQGSIALGSNSSFVTNGATVILTSSAAGGSGIGTFTMQSATASVSMTAPNSSSNLATKGFAIIQDRAATTDTLANNGNCSSNCNVMQGGPNSSITGAVYFPQGNLSYQGSPNLSSTGCLQIIADTLNWQGTPKLLVNGCAGTGVNVFGPISAALVE
jgi:Flp pilus assembly protein TadG